MFGHQNLSEQSGTFLEDKWKFDLFADSDGMLAILSFGEIKFELRKQPKAVSFFIYLKFRKFNFLNAIDVKTAWNCC